MDTTEAYAIIQDARSWIQAYPQTEVADSTYTRYTKTWRRIKGDVLGALKNTMCSGTHYPRKAAALYGLGVLLRHLLKAQDETQRELKALESRLTTNNGVISNASDELRRRHLRHQWRKQLEMLSKALHEAQAVSNHKHQGAWEGEKNSQRNTLPRAHNWREIIIDELERTGNSYALAATVLAVTGCRPSELELGVIVQRQGDTAWIEVLGKKLSHRTNGGQPWRQIRVDLAHPTARLLRYLQDGEIIEVKAKPRKLLDAISNAGKRAMPKRRANVTPYHLRHQMAADLKRAGFSTTEVAMALGHAAEDSQKHYGTARQSRGGSAVIEVTAAREPKPRSPLPEKEETPSPSD